MSDFHHWPWLLVSAMPPLMMLKSYRQMNNMVGGYASRLGVNGDPYLQRFYGSARVRIRALTLLVATEALFNALYWAAFSVSPTMLLIYAGCTVGIIVGLTVMYRSYAALYEAIKAGSPAA
jgi:hypothetical protein